MLLSGHQLQLSFVVSFPVKARFNGSKRGMRTGLCVPAARPPSIFCGGESRKPSHIFALKACGPLLQAQDQPTGLYMPAVRIRSFTFRGGPIPTRLWSWKPSRAVSNAVFVGLGRHPTRCNTHRCAFFFVGTVFC